MLLNEPTPHQTRPAAATAAAAPSARELPAVEVDGAPVPAPPRAVGGAAADTVAFTAVDEGSGTGADESASSDASADRDAGPDAESSTVALDVEAVKRAVAEGLAAPDAIATVSLNAEAVKQAVAQAPTVAFGPVDTSSDADAPAAEETAPDTEGSPDTDDSPVAADTETTSSDPIADTVDSASTADSSADSSTDSSGGSSTDLVPSPDAAVDSDTPAYLASTDLLASTSNLVAVPETADDVIATIHAAATAVAAADRRARQAAVVKDDPWTGLDLHQPPAPAPVGNVLDLLSPVLERPLLVVEQPGLPAAADVVALHRSELEVDFVEPPVVAAGAEPPIPPRYGPGLSVLPHIEFPV